MTPSKRIIRKEKKERYLEYDSKKLQADKIKELFGKPNPRVRKELYNLMKDKKDYKKQLKKMKEIFIGGK